MSECGVRALMSEFVLELLGLLMGLRLAFRFVKSLALCRESEKVVFAS
jgi:hypothetical protein